MSHVLQTIFSLIIYPPCHAFFHRFLRMNWMAFATRRAYSTVSSSCAWGFFFENSPNTQDTYSLVAYLPLGIAVLNRWYTHLAETLRTKVIAAKICHSKGFVNFPAGYLHFISQCQIRKTCKVKIMDFDTSPITDICGRYVEVTKKCLTPFSHLIEGYRRDNFYTARDNKSGQKHYTRYLYCSLSVIDS